MKACPILDRGSWSSPALRLLRVLRNLAMTVGGISIFGFRISFVILSETAAQLFHRRHRIILLCRAHLPIPFRRINYRRPQPQVAGHRCRRDVLAQSPPQALVDFLLRIERLIPCLVHVHLLVPRAFGNRFQRHRPASFSLASSTAPCIRSHCSVRRLHPVQRNITVSKSKTFNASARKLGLCPVIPMYFMTPARCASVPGQSPVGPRILCSVAMSSTPWNW